MSATAVHQPNDALVRAQRILAEDRGLSNSESAIARDDLYRTTDPVARGTLSAIYAEVERRAREKSQAETIRRTVAAHEAVAAHRQQRPARFAALSTLQRALLIAADDFGGTDSQVGKALLRVAALCEDEGTAHRAPPETFEPEGQLR